MRSFEEVIKFAKERGPKTISVACCQDKEVLMALYEALCKKYPYKSWGNSNCWYMCNKPDNVRIIQGKSSYRT
ncbi:hypothetical protein ACTPEF_23525 [Clostridioides difficile]